ARQRAQARVGPREGEDQRRGIGQLRRERSRDEGSVPSGGLDDSSGAGSVEVGWVHGVQILVRFERKWPDSFKARETLKGGLQSSGGFQRKMYEALKARETLKGGLQSSRRFQREGTYSLKARWTLKGGLGIGEGGREAPLPQR